MYHITEQNERRGRHQALLLTITLHVALGVALFLYSTQTPDTKPTNTTSHTAQNNQLPKTNTVPEP